MSMGTWVQPHKQAACIPVTQDPAHGIAEVLRLLPAALGCSWSSSATDPHQEPLGTSCRQAPTFCLQTFPRVVRFSPTACPRSGCIFFFFSDRCLYSGDFLLKMRLRLPSRGDPAEYSGGARSPPGGAVRSSAGAVGCARQRRGGRQTLPAVSLGPYTHQTSWKVTASVPAFKPSMLPCHLYSAQGVQHRNQA